MIGKTISHYKIVEKLGSGGMGVVYKAQDTQLGRFVALKFLPPHISQTEKQKKRFVQEAKAASALDHHNICNIHEIDETEDGRMFIVMAYYQGESLQEKISRGPLNLNDAFDVAIQIGEGLGKAHAKEIVHRDIKPANVILPEDGVVKIIDFGLAKLRSQTQLTKEGSTVGTVAYMSPEQTQGTQLDQRTDIWALGVVLYQMITGKQPFKGDYDQAVLYSILHESPEPITALRTGVPVELERIVNKALAKKPDARYQNIDELLFDLKSLHRGPPKMWLGTLKTSKKNRVYLFGVLAGAVIFILAAVFFLLPSKSEAVSRKSVAVLFFDNLSGNPENEYFSDGISEDIRTLLSQVVDLTVISRTAVLAYKNRAKPVQEIGRELRVDTILDGSVRRQGNEVRIACQLVDTQTAQSIWAQNYDRELKNIFEVQSGVARQVVTALKIQLSPSAGKRIGKWPTENLKAYENWLRGRTLHYRYTKKDNEKAVGLFKKAIALDPNFAWAHAHLAKSFHWRHNFGFGEAWLDSAIEASQKAIALDPEVPLGYSALGTLYSFKGENPNRVLELMHKAVELEPNNSGTLNNIGVILKNQGELDKAVPWLKRAIAVNPKNSFPRANLTAIYRWLGDGRAALHWVNEILALNPESWIGIANLAKLYLSQGKHELAFEQARKLIGDNSAKRRGLLLAGEAKMLMDNYPEARGYLEQNIAMSQGEEPDTKLRLGFALWKLEQQNKAQKWLDQAHDGTMRAIEEGKRHHFAYWYSLRIAVFHAIQNNREQALLWLKKAVAAGAWLAYNDGMIMPWWDPFRQDAQFKQLMLHMKTQIDEMRRKVKHVEKGEQ